MNIELNIEFGKLIIEPNNKEEGKLFYKFFPSKEFDFKMKEQIKQMQDFQKEVEEKLEKKLSYIYERRTD